MAVEWFVNELGGAKPITCTIGFSPRSSNLEGTPNEQSG